jgi:polynucleotide 5'-hydroxyl-kinase GRC3/NOL9
LHDPTVSHNLCRYRRVAILDVDPGQPLLSAPGLLSLHIIRHPRFAPPFANCSTAAKAHFFGGITPRSSVERWEEIVQDLIQTWRLDWAYSPLEDSPEDIEGNSELIGTVIPLVINTHGWMKGYGAELQRKLELMAEPTHIFTLAEPNSQNTDFFESQESSSGAALQYQLQPLPPSPLSSRFTANDLRSISILSYFHLIPNSQDLDTRAVPTVIWDTSRALCDTPPWKVSYGKNNAIKHVYLTGPWADGVVPSEIARVMDCAVVGLVATEEDIPSFPHQDDDPSDGVPIPYIQGEDPPTPEYSRCLGLALIRAVDTSSGNFHILTPVEPRLLSSCRVVLKGDLTLPIWGFLRFGEAPAGETPYIDWGTARGVRGGEKKRIRRNLMRKGQV